MTVRYRLELRLVDSKKHPNMRHSGHLLPLLAVAVCDFRLISVRVAIEYHDAVGSKIEGLPRLSLPLLLGPQARQESRINYNLISAV